MVKNNTWSVIATHRFHQVCLEFEEKRHNSELKFSSAKIGDTTLVGKEEIKDTLFKKEGDQVSME